MTTKHFKQLNGSPAVHTVLEGLASLHDGTFYDTQTFINWNHQVIAAYDDELGTIVGVMVFEKCEWMGCHNVILAYVVPDHRRQGVFKALWMQLRSLVAASPDCKVILGGTHPDNVAMRAAMESVGRKPLRIMYEYKEE